MQGHDSSNPFKMSTYQIDPDHSEPGKVYKLTPIKFSAFVTFIADDGTESAKQYHEVDVGGSEEPLFGLSISEQIDKALKAAAASWNDIVVGREQTSDVEIDQDGTISL